MKTVEGGNFSYTRGVVYPIRVTEDTEFVRANFAQAAPHTAGVFDVTPGVRLRLVECNLVNCTVPDEAEVVGGNLAHIVVAETSNPERPTVNLLHDCDKCSCARAVLVDRLSRGDCPKDRSGRILHSELKDAFRARRESAEKDVDVAWQTADNEAALARWTPDEQEVEGWFSSLWGSIKSALGLS